MLQASLLNIPLNMICVAPNPFRICPETCVSGAGLRALDSPILPAKVSISGASNSRGMNAELRFQVVEIRAPEGCNLILGQSHFIKTVEDIYEALVNSSPRIRFGLAFCESSGPCLVRHEGNDEELRRLAYEKALEIGAGHCFLIFIREAYPINVLNSLKHVPEVCGIYCATANPVQVILVETEQGRGIIGVVDGYRSKGVEKEEDIEERRRFLRRIGYKF
jgi:adenosine/AMP kinase